MRGGIKKILDENKDYIISLYRDGYTQKEIAAKLDVNYCTIGRRLRKYGIATFTPIVVDNGVIKDMYVNECSTCREIASYFGVSAAAINERLHQLGIYRKNTYRPFTKTLLRKNISKDTICELYYNKKLNMSEISVMYSCSRAAIERRFKEYGLKPRSKKESCLRGKKHPNYGKPMSEVSKSKLIDTLKKQTKLIKTYGKGTGDYYTTPNQGIKWMRSGWEIKVADYLTKSGINWYYECEWLEVGEGEHYLPDFYLPDENKYIEVKGWKTNRTMKKYDLAKDVYNVELWDKLRLEELGIPTR